MLTNIWHWVKYQQTIVVINWQPCTVPLGRQVDPIQSCIDYFKGLDMRTQFNCILQVTLTDPPHSYVEI